MPLDVLDVFILGAQAARGCGACAHALSSYTPTKAQYFRENVEFTLPGCLNRSWRTPTLVGVMCSMHSSYSVVARLSYVNVLAWLTVSLWPFGD